MYDSAIRSFNVGWGTSEARYQFHVVVGLRLLCRSFPGSGIPRTLVVSTLSHLADTLAKRARMIALAVVLVGKCP